MPNEMDLDPNFQERAKKLIQDAAAGVKASMSPAQAVKGHYLNREFAEKFGANAAMMLVNVLGNVVGAATGVAGLAAAYVVNPVIAVIFGQVANKVFGEAKYAIESHLLKKGIFTDPAGDTLKDASLVPAAAAKVMRKLDRVVRRFYQLQAGALGIWFSIRHPRTWFRARELGETFTPGELFTAFFDPADPRTQDRELNNRLFELNYYAQLLGNYASALLDRMVQERDDLIAGADHVFAHVLRQVHVSGNHDDCGSNCYTITQAELGGRLKMFFLFKKALAPNLGLVSADASVGQVRAGFYEQQRRQWVPLGDSSVLVQNIRLALSQEAAPDEPPPTLRQQVREYLDDKTKFTRDETFVDRAAFHAEYGKNVNIIDWSERIAGADPVPNAAPCTLFGFLADELTDTLRNRLIKRAVLNKKGRVFALMGEVMASREEAIAAVTAISKNKDILSRIFRVAEKVKWYVSKIQDIESTFKEPILSVLVNNRRFENSAFASCGEAWNVVYTLHYLIRQYEKLITFLVYLEIILVEADKKVAGLLNMRIGGIYSPGQPIPPRPRPMAGGDAGPLLGAVPALGAPPSLPVDPFEGLP